MKAEPLTYEQAWGEPEEDELMEDILVVESDSKASANFDDAHWCPECGNPVHLCTCDPINQGEDYD